MIIMSTVQGCWIQITFLVLIFCHEYRVSVQAQERCQKMSCLSHAVNTLMDGLKWTSVAVINDNKSNEEIHLTTTIKQLVYNIDEIDSRLMMTDIHNLLFPDINVIIALRQTSTLQLLSKIDNFDLYSNRTTDFRHRSKLIILTTSSSMLNDVNVNHLENVAVIINDEESSLSTQSRNRTHIFTLHNTPQGRLFIPIPSKEPTLAGPLKRIYPNTQYGYNNRRLLVTTVKSGVYVDKKTINGQVTFSGYAFEILDTIAKKLNFSYDIIESDDGDWGNLHNGQWNGMVGQLSRRVKYNAHTLRKHLGFQGHEVDLAAADLTVHYGRAQVMDYVFPAINIEDVDVIYRKKTAPARSLFLLVNSLQPAIYLIFFGVLTGVLVMFIIVENPQICEGESIILLRQLSSISWQFIGSVFRQGFQTEPKSTAGKILLSSHWILVILISSVYCTNLMAALSAGVETFKLSSISDLVDSDYTVGVPKSSSFFINIQESQQSEMRRLYDKVIAQSQTDPEILLNDDENHMRRVKAGTHVYFLYKSSAERYIADDCNLARIGIQVLWAKESISFGLPKGHPIKTDMDTVMHQLEDSGILEILWKKWTYGDNTTTSCDELRGVYPITLGEVGGGFLVLCGGLGLAFVVLLVEIRLRRKNNSKSLV